MNVVIKKSVYIKSNKGLNEAKWNINKKNLFMFIGTLSFLNLTACSGSAKTDSGKPNDNSRAVSLLDVDAQNAIAAVKKEEAEAKIAADEAKKIAQQAIGTPEEKEKAEAAEIAKRKAEAATEKTKEVENSFKKTGPPLPPRSSKVPAAMEEKPKIPPTLPERPFRSISSTDQLLDKLYLLKEKFEKLTDVKDENVFDSLKLIRFNLSFLFYRLLEISPKIKGLKCYTETFVPIEECIKQQEKVDECQRKMKELEEEKNVLEEKVKKIEAANLTKKAKLEADKLRVQTEITKIKGENGKYNQLVKEKKEKLRLIPEAKEKAERTSLQERYQTIESEMQKLDDEIKALEEKSKNLDSQLAKMESELKKESLKLKKVKDDFAIALKIKEESIEGLISKIKESFERIIYLINATGSGGQLGAATLLGVNMHFRTNSASSESLTESEIARDLSWYESEFETAEEEYKKAKVVAEAAAKKAAEEGTAEFAEYAEYTALAAKEAENAAQAAAKELKEFKVSRSIS